MSFPNLTFWSNLLSTVCIEVCVVVALGVAAQSAFRRAYWKRAMWQMTLLCLVLISASEWTGAGRGAVSSLFGKKRIEQTHAPLTVSSGAEFYTTTSVVTPPLPAPQKPVWWPGFIWLAGIAIVLGRMTTAQGLLFLLRFRREKIADGNLKERVARVAKMLGLRRKVCLLRLPESISPMAFGILFPTIGLPPGFETGFSSVEQDAILAHELAHLAILDPFWFRLSDFASAILWWHPLAWWARRSLHGASELAADEATALVPDGPGSLAHCLVSLGKKMTVSRGWGWTGINGGFRSKLGKRVERLTRMSAGHARSFVGWRDKLVRIAATLLIVPSIVLMFGAFQTAKGEKENAWSNSWNSSPGVLLAMAAADETDKLEDNGVIVGLIQDAKLLYEKDKFDEAELILVHVLKHDPSNKTAASYLAIIKEARLKDTGSKMLEIWAEHEVVTRAEYLEYSNILYNLGKIPEDKLGTELTTAYGNLADSELKEKSIHLSYAKEQMTAITAEYGKENPKYKTASEQLQQAKDDYDNKVEAIVAGIRAHVDQASNYLQLIIKNEEDIRTKYNQQTEILVLQRANQTPTQVVPKPTKSNALHTESFQLYPIDFKTTLSAAVGSVPGSDTEKTNDTEQIKQLLLTYFAKAGAKITAPEKIVIYDGSPRVLVVRATSEKLQIIEQALGSLNKLPSQVTIRADFVELSQRDAREFGFENFLQTKEPNFTSVLSPSQYQTAIRNIKQNTHEKMVSMPTITTLSGRQAHVASQDLFDNVPVGPVYDMIPTVLDDGYSIKTVLIPTFTEFLQYDPTGTFTPSGPASSGTPIASTLPLPHFRKRQVISTCDIRDGQTVVAGQLVSDKPSEPKRLQLYFVTPTIIDPAGNRVHSDEELSGKH